MCGLAGFWSEGGLGRDSRRHLEGMIATVGHRGPDDEGLWLDQASGVALGHRRLAVLDPSPAGHQPMLSASRRFVIVFNGEIYNFPELRRLCAEDVGSLRGRSDTEVILAVIERFGLVEAVKRFVGMFAFALYDRQKRELHLVRDRIGEKPLYYGWSEDNLLFASELKALRTFPAWEGRVSREALTLFFRYGYIPAPHSIYDGVRKIEPGTILTFKNARSRQAQERVYWSAREMVDDGLGDPIRADVGEILDEFQRRLDRSIEDVTISDVPVGALLSGGIDSTLVVALMQARSATPVRTFTIGFEDRTYDEAVYARRVARSLGTDHTELYVTPARALATVPSLPSVYDEPFSDPSQIPMLLVAELASQSVKVCLSGDGGDELFGGYDRYQFGQRVWRQIGWLPGSARRWVGKRIRAVSPSGWDRILSPLLGLRSKYRLTGSRLHKLADVMATEDRGAFYRDLMSHWTRPQEVVRGASNGAPSPVNQPEADNLLDWMMWLDLVTYLPDDIFVKVDRASMAHSLESRAPFVDHRLVEFAWRLPRDLKVRNGRGKWIARQLVHRYVEPELVDRPKMGFGIPLADWLRGPLRDWAEPLLDQSRLEREGFLNPAPIRERWNQHLDGTCDWQYHMWDVLMFQAWLETN